MSDTPERAAAVLVAALQAPAAERPRLPATMVVVAHPDDETVGAGARLPRLAGARLVYVTDGAPRDGRDAASHGYTLRAYAQVRQQELEAALALCGIGRAQLTHLGCPDQQAAQRLAELARTLAKLFAQHRIEAVLTQPYEGGHPDHDATAFAVHAAAGLLRRAGDTPPAIVEMTSYHLGAEGICPGAFLPADGIEEALVQLTPDEQRAKRALFDCFATQRQTLQYFPVATERYRRAPAYAFLQAPHAGPLFYEGHPWGITGAQFRSLAGQALAELGLEDRPWA